MTLKNILVPLIFLIVIVSGANAQVKGLKIGHELPDFFIPKIIHDSKQSARISDFKDRLLIIDFWATSCSGCVEALPKMQALQQQFGEKIKVLPVTYESTSLVNDFWRQNKHTKSLTLPSVVEDKQFREYFPWQSIPHEVWVYKGKIIGITYPEYVDANNIMQVLEGKIPNWPVKDDFYTYDAVNYPLFTPDEKQIDVNSTLLEYTAISDYKEYNGANAAGVFGNEGIVRDSVKKTIRTWFVNNSIYLAYYNHWSRLVNFNDLIKPFYKINPNQIIWEVSDPSKYIRYAPGSPKPEKGYDGDWLRKNAICFESMYADIGQTDKDISRSIIADLDRLLGLHVRWEKRKEKVLVFVKKNGSTEQLQIFVKGTRPGPQTITISALTEKMNMVDNPYVFDETGYEHGSRGMNINIHSWIDIEAIRRAIAPYGLDLKEEERMVDKFVFSEVNGGLLINPEMIAKARAEQAAQMELELPSAEQNKALLEMNKNKHGVVALPSGLQYKIVKSGTGIKPSANDRVILHYKGMLANGKIFDSSYKNGRPVVFGVDKVIKGWTEALQLMPVGSKWILYVPSELAYGKAGELNIAPYSTLVFEIELLKVIKEKN